jgi:hypothetical protein
MDPNQPGGLPGPKPPQQPTQPQQQVQTDHLFPAPNIDPGHPSQYDFITNPAKTAKKPPLLSKNNRSGLIKLVLIVLGVLVLITAAASMLFGGDSNRETLLTVARKQSQIISIAESGADKAGSNQAKALALSTQLTITTDQWALINQLTKNGGKVKGKEYSSAPSSQVTSELATAERNGRFDEVFSNIIKQQLTEYQRDLQAANTALDSKTAKIMIAKDYENAGLLLDTK